jgi:hypothetical protein
MRFTGCHSVMDTHEPKMVRIWKTRVTHKQLAGLQEKYRSIVAVIQAGHVRHHKGLAVDGRAPPICTAVVMPFRLSEWPMQK